MGIHGIYKEIGPGQRIALSKLAVEKFEETSRPLRIAIDISIWLFQIQSGKGGTNPALRTFYYRLLRLISLSIHPLFVFDGPNKPPFKRNKRTGPNVASIPEFLAKQLLKQFGLPFHLAPGEAEAECAFLQREGIVDAVLSEDVDTLMFGSGLTLRNWSPESSSNKVPTHVNIYNATETKAGSGLDREGMILIALMSGGDYIPEGIPGCGPKLACEAARAGFGRDLCKISRKDHAALGIWRERLAYELRTNESKFFKRKHGALAIPEDFPNPEVLGYYTHPVISSLTKVERLRQTLKWDQDLDFAELRTFTGDAFDWTKLGGAKKFIRNLAPALLVKRLRMRGQALNSSTPYNVDHIQQEEGELVKAIHGKRNHVSTDGVTELRISFTPHDLVPIDLDAEEPDDDLAINGDSEDEGPLIVENDGQAEPPGSPSKKRGPSTYDPLNPEKIWVFETYAKVGVPLKVQDWEDSFRNARKFIEMRHANKEATKGAKAKKKVPDRGMQKGALNRFTKVTKPGEIGVAPSAKGTIPGATKGSSCPSTTTTAPVTIEILSSPIEQQRGKPNQHLVIASSIIYELPPTVTKRRRSPLRHTQTDTAILDMTGDKDGRPTTPYVLRDAKLADSPCSLPSPSQLLPTKRARRPQPTNSVLVRPSTPPAKGRLKATTDSQVGPSSPARQTDITQYFTPSKRRTALERQREKDGQSQCIQRPPSLSFDSLDLTGSSVQPNPRQFSRSDPAIADGKKAISSSRESLVEILPNLVNARARACQSQFPKNSSSQVEAPAVPQEVAELDLSGPSQPLGPDMTGFRLPPALSGVSRTRTAAPIQAKDAVLRRSPRNSSGSSSSGSNGISHAPERRREKKGMVRIRESLAGTFALEEIDLSHDVRMPRNGLSATRNKSRTEKERKAFRVSEISVVDLTGD